jgi:hypothetical protein
LSAPVLSRRELEEGGGEEGEVAQNFAVRADGDTVGTEDIKMDHKLYVFTVYLVPCVVIATILFSFKTEELGFTDR